MLILIFACITSALIATLIALSIANALQPVGVLSAEKEEQYVWALVKAQLASEAVAKHDAKS